MGSQMALIPEEFMWFVAEGRAQCPGERTLSPPRRARRGWPSLPHCSSPAEDGCGIWGELGPRLPGGRGSEGLAYKMARAHPAPPDRYSHARHLQPVPQLRGGTAPERPTSTLLGSQTNRDPVLSS